jgi:hypothetical protein
MSPSPHLQTETCPVSVTCSTHLEFPMCDKVHNPIILSVIHSRQNPLDCTND